MKAIVMVLATAALLVAWGCGGDGEAPAEKAGEFLAGQQAKFAKGLGDGLEKDGDEAGKSLAKGGEKVLAGAGEGLAEDGEETGAKVAEGVGNVLKGVLKGLDKALAIVVEPGEGMSGTGAAVVRTDQRVVEDNRMQLNVQLSLAKPFEGKLILDLIDENNAKLGSSEASINGAAGETVTATFLFEAGSRAGFPGVRHVLRRP